MKIYKLKVGSDEKIFRNLESFKTYIQEKYSFNIETVDEFNKSFEQLSKPINICVGMNSLNITTIDKSNILKAYNNNMKIVDIVDNSGLSKASICNLLKSHKSEVSKENRYFKREVRRIFKTEDQLKKEIIEASNTSSNLTKIAKQVGTSFYKAREILNSSLTSRTK